MRFLRALTRGLFGGYIAASLMIAAALVSKEDDPQSKALFLSQAGAFPGAELVDAAVSHGRSLILPEAKAEETAEVTATE